MARGLWRWWTEENGADVWHARVEVQPGQWEDVAQAAYERAGHQPAFWDLPLKDDYIENAMRDPVAEADYEIKRKAFQPAILVTMGIGAVFFVGTILVTIALALFG